MKVVDYQKSRSLICSCGHILRVVQDDSLNKLRCDIPNCDHYGVKYKFPESVYIELEKIND